MRLTDMCSLDIPLAFLNTGASFAHYRCSGTFPSSYNHSKIIKSGLTMTSASSLSTSGCNLSGSMDLYVQFV